MSTIDAKSNQYVGNTLVKLTDVPTRIIPSGSSHSVLILSDRYPIPIWMTEAQSSVVESNPICLYERLNLCSKYGYSIGSRFIYKSMNKCPANRITIVFFFIFEKIL
jgi:hypothetical protein